MKKKRNSRGYIALTSIILVTIVLISIYIKSTNNNEVESILEGEITFVSNRTDKEAEILSLIESFEKENPKVNVKLELVGDVDGILERKLTVGELPDVTLVPSSIGNNEYGRYFVPITELGFNEENLYTYGMGTGLDQELYCINSAINWPVVIYNKDIFKEANIDILPRTIDEFYTVCEVLNNSEVIPIAVNFRQTWVMNVWAETIPTSLDNEFAINVISEKKEILSNDSAMYKSLQFIRELVQGGYTEAIEGNYDWQQFKNDMVDGKIAMTIWNSDFIFQLEDLGMDINSIGIFPLPETEIIKIYGDYKFAVSKNSQYPEVAKEFLKYMFEESRYPNAINTLSPLKNNERSKAIIDEMNDFGIPTIVYSDYVKNQSVENGIFESQYLNIKKMSNLDGFYVQEYIFEEDLDDLISKTNEKWNYYLKE